VSYGPIDQLDFSVNIYRGEARETGKNENSWDWAMAMEAWPSATVSFGLSYQSDLAYWSKFCNNCGVSAMADLRVVWLNPMMMNLTIVLICWRHNSLLFFDSCSRTNCRPDKKQIYSAMGAFS
jgi:hypothetical protein